MSTKSEHYVSPIGRIARQQVVNDGVSHSCCICYKFTADKAEVVEKHLTKEHKSILESIVKVQELT